MALAGAETFENKHGRKQTWKKTELDHLKLHIQQPTSAFWQEHKLFVRKEKVLQVYWLQDIKNDRIFSIIYDWEMLQMD